METHIMNDKFLLFSSCTLVKGAYQSLICDLHRNFLYPIPDSLYQIIDKYQGCSIEHIKSQYNREHDEIIDEYFAALEEKELIFFTADTSLFPPLSMEWDEPYHFTNAIIDIGKETANSITFIQELKKLGCQSVQIRVFDTLPLLEVEKVLSQFENGRISSIELLLGYDETYTVEVAKELCDKFHRLSVLTIHSSPEQSIHHFRPNEFGNIFFITDNITSETCCGQIGPNFFTINVKTFTESQQFNSCLNRKISIDKHGHIKNCPSMGESFGHIQDTNLDTVQHNPEFKKHWNTNKDSIAVCKDCEFRYICTDCRAYIEDPKDILSKPLKCGYNPYTGEWSEWTKNPLKQKVKEFYQIL